MSVPFGAGLVPRESAAHLVHFDLDDWPCSKGGRLRWKPEKWKTRRSQQPIYHPLFSFAFVVILVSQLSCSSDVTSGEECVSQ